MLQNIIKDGPGSDPSSRLRKALKEGRANTELMIRKLQSFEDQLNDIETDLRPLQNGTQKYTVAKENISKTLLECGKTYEYFRIASEVKPIANAPFSQEKAREIYEALERLSKAKAFFEKHREMRSSSSMLNGVDTMLTALENKCVDQIVSILGVAGSAVISRPAEKGEITQYSSSIPLPDSSLREIQGISTVMDSLGLLTHIQRCGELRQKQVKIDVKTQEDGLKGSWKKLQSEDFPYIIRNNSPLHLFLGYASELLRGELQLWSGLFATSVTSMNTFLHVCHIVIDSLNAQIQPFLGSAVYTTRGGSLVHKNNIFLIRLDMLDAFMLYYHSLYELCKPDFRKESSASLALMEIRSSLVRACIEGIDELLRTSAYPGPILDPKLESGAHKPDASGHMTESFTSANAGEKCDLQPITNDIVHCCAQLLQHGKFFISKLNALARDIGVEMRADAKSHSVLIYTLLQNLKSNFKERSDMISVAVTAIGTAAASAGGFNIGIFSHSAAKEATKLDRDMNTHNLFEVGNKEAELLVMSGCPHLYLANNFSKLQEFLQSNLNDLQQCISPKLVEAYCQHVQEVIHGSRKAFCETIGSTVSMLPSDIQVFDEKYKSTTDKTALGRLVKAKFAAFNAGLEALLAQQGAWRISSATLRFELGRQMADTIIPAYKAFYDKYSTTNFSKRHLDQYVRFTSEDANLILGRFFGGSGVEKDIK